MFKDLLVATTGRGDDAAAFSTACALAAPGDGHVAVLVQVRVPMPDSGGGMGMFPVDAYVALRDQLRLQADADCARWRESLRRAGVMGEVRLSMDAWSSPPQTAAQQARYADVAVIGLGEAGSLPLEVHDPVAKVLSGSGRPLLVVPQGCEPAAFDRVVIAWQPGASATRAVHDALPLLARARAIHVLCVDPARGESAHGDEPGADIARHLARHDLAVTVHVESGGGDEPGEMLLRRCRELGARLLVMGGYGHSRFREWALGGTTRHILRNATLPVFMAH
jgi:nucleotide-binding universal stress UspA family protein